MMMKREDTVTVSSARTTVTATVTPNGETLVMVHRDGHAVHHFSLPREGQGDPDSEPGKGPTE